MSVDALKNRVTLLLLFLLCAFMPLLFLSFVEEQFRLPKELFFQFISVCAFLLFLSLTAWHEYSFERYLQKSRMWVPAVLPFHYGILLFAFFAALSTLFSSQHYFSLLYCLNLACGIFLFYLLFLSRFTEGEVRLLLFAAFLGGEINACYGLLQIYGEDPLFVPSGYMSAGRQIGGFIDNANTFGCFLSIVFPLGLSLFFLAEKSIYKVLLFLSFLPFGWALYAAETRGALLAFGATSLFFIFFYGLRYQRGGVLARALAVVLVLGVAVMSLQNPDFYKRFTFQGENGLNKQNERLIEWTTAFEMFKDHPFLGVGAGAYQYAYKEYEVIVKEKPHSPFHHTTFYMAKHVHNEYLQVLAEVGIAGFLVFLALIGYYLFAVISYLFRLSKKGRNERKFLIHSGILCSVSALLICALTSLPFHITPLIVIPLLFAGYQVGVLALEQRK